MNFILTVAEAKAKKKTALLLHKPLVRTPEDGELVKNSSTNCFQRTCRPPLGYGCRLFRDE
jgi:hypothetical protein